MCGKPSGPGADSFFARHHPFPLVCDFEPPQGRNDLREREEATSSHASPCFINTHSFPSRNARRAEAATKSFAPFEEGRCRSKVNDIEEKKKEWISGSKKADAREGKPDEQGQRGGRQSRAVWAAPDRPRINALQTEMFCVNRITVSASFAVTASVGGRLLRPAIFISMWWSAAPASVDLAAAPREQNWNKFARQFRAKDQLRCLLSISAWPMNRYVGRCRRLHADDNAGIEDYAPCKQQRNARSVPLVR